MLHNSVIFTIRFAEYEHILGKSAAEKTIFVFYIKYVDTFMSSIV